MKKKLLFLSVAALFLCGGVFTATQLTQKEKVSNLTLANIEAMTGTDDVGGGFQFPDGQPQPSPTVCGNSGCTSSISLCMGGGSGCNELRCSIHNKQH